jgi:hypothetical protein
MENLELQSRQGLWGLPYSDLVTVRDFIPTPIGGWYLVHNAWLSDTSTYWISSDVFRSKFKQINL